MKRAILIAALVETSWLAAGVASADVVFPARLDVSERERGIYDVSFTLPIVEGRKLRAEPLLPPTCREIGSRSTGLSSGGLTAVWSVHCEPASLAGEAIFVEGLLGTQTDLAFSLTLADGRVYSEILRPSRPGFLVPEPPSLAALVSEAVAGGMRRSFRHLELWLLLSAAAMIGARMRATAVAAGAFAGGHFISQWLGHHGWLEIAPLTRDIFTWAAVAAPALRLAGGGPVTRRRSFPGWLPGLLLGMLFGGANIEALSTDGLSHGEQVATLAFFAVGAGAATLIMATAAHELRAAIATVGRDTFQRTAELVFAYAAGSLAIGMVLISTAGLVSTKGSGLKEPIGLLLVAAIAGPVSALLGWRAKSVGAAFVVLAASGAAAGLLRVQLPMASLLTVGTLLALAFPLALDRPMPAGWGPAIAVVAAPAHAWATAQALAENVSRSTAVAGGTVLAAVCVAFVSLSLCRSSQTGRLPAAARLSGAAVALVAVAWRADEYRTWIDREVMSAAALGVARIPLLAVALLVLALLLWPRRRRVARELGVEQPSRWRHLVAAGAAFLLIPFGTVAVQIPLAGLGVPSAGSARPLVEKVLSDTYHAFNIADENELYDALSESVATELLDDLYLDSRRRLTAGTREGTEVTVRDVSVLEIGEPAGGAGIGGGFAYDCRWQVVARVRHLQHVHHRQNVYNGVLTLRREGGGWKIAAVELVSEDRSVVSWKPT